MAETLPTKLLMPRRGSRQIELRAWRCLERCRKLREETDIPLPVPVEEWIENPLGIRFGVTDLSYLGDGVLGASFIREREILVDEKVLANEGRYRFTVAHELGHLILHAKLRDRFHDFAEYDRESETVERQADRFAAAFLTPLPLLERELLALLTLRSLNAKDAVIQLMRPTPESESLWRRLVLPMVARKFGVSLAAAVHRCHGIQPQVEDAPPLLPHRLVEPLLLPVTGRQGVREETETPTNGPNLFTLAEP